MAVLHRFYCIVFFSLILLLWSWRFMLVWVQATWRISTNLYGFNIGHHVELNGFWWPLPNFQDHCYNIIAQFKPKLACVLHINRTQGHHTLALDCLGTSVYAVKSIISVNNRECLFYPLAEAVFFFSTTSYTPQLCRFGWYIIGLLISQPKYMGESFQDYSWIQDFEADFP